MEDLKGKTIGLHSYDHEHLAIMLAKHGMKLTDVVVKDIGDDTDSLIAHKIDAQLAYMIDEQVAMEVKGRRFVHFPVTRMVLIPTRRLTGPHRMF